MNYSKIYQSIINKANNRCLLQNIYKERHHIIPSCLGGNNSKYNIVELEAREHFICHWLLSKMHSNHKINYAFWCMIHRKSKNQYRDYKINSRSYEKIKKLIAVANKSRIISQETRDKISKANKGMIISEWQKKQISKAFKGKTRTEATKRKISAAHKGRIISPEHKKNLSIAGKNRIHSSSTKQKMRETSLSKSNVVCVYCGKEGKIAPMKRWHFDNCKNKSSLVKFMYPNLAHEFH